MISPSASVCMCAFCVCHMLWRYIRLSTVSLATSTADDKDATSRSDAAAVSARGWFRAQ